MSIIINFDGSFFHINYYNIIKVNNGEVTSDPSTQEEQHSITEHDGGDKMVINVIVRFPCPIPGI